MQKIVLDSDACIKLFKSDVLEEVCGAFYCAMTREVYEETVVAGMRNFRHEAEALKKMVEENKISLIEVKESGLLAERVGHGETSVLRACKQHGCLAVSDDQRFLSVLENHCIEFHTPASLIVAMQQNKILEKGTALAALEKLRPLTNKEVIERALKEIGGE